MDGSFFWRNLSTGEKIADDKVGNVPALSLRKTVEQCISWRPQASDVRRDQLEALL